MKATENKQMPVIKLQNQLTFRQQVENAVHEERVKFDEIAHEVASVSDYEELQELRKEYAVQKAIVETLERCLAF